MKDNQSKDLKFYQKAALFNRLFSRAVKDAQENNRQKGITNVYSFNGKTFYELPDGEITSESPLK